MITFAVIGHNEATYLPTSLGQAIEAAGDGDRVIFVDSGSSDGSADTAASLGVAVVSAPVGKGRAVAAALEHCDGGAICLVDADIEASESNIPAALAARIAKIHVGRYWGPLRDKRDIGAVQAETVLDLAVDHGRLEPACRPGWERWVETVTAVGQRRDPHGLLGEADWQRLQAILNGPRPPVAVPPDARSAPGARPTG